ncbi:MAG: hypothetical protein ACKOHH_04835, partial [Bacteroidota bacterium]
MLGQRYSTNLAARSSPFNNTFDFRRVSPSSIFKDPQTTPMSNRMTRTILGYGTALALGLWLG